MFKKVNDFQKNYANCVDDCNEALKINPGYLKAISRRSRALAKMNNLKLALVDVTALMRGTNSSNLKDIAFADNIINILSKILFSTFVFL